MRRYFQLFVILLTASPLAAKATLYEFEYTGQISYLSGGGFGYHLNDNVSGAFTFDLAKSNGDIWEEDYIVDYYSKNNADFVKGYQTENLGQNLDNVLVYDGAEADHSIPRLDAGITITDANYVDYGSSGSRTYGMEVNIAIEDFDWLTSGKINAFSFGDSDQLASGSSGIYYDMRFAKDGSNGVQSEYAGFRLSSAKLSLVDVPEPSALLLLFSGGLVLFLRRWLLNA